MDSLESDFAAGLFRSPESPCLSLYQPTSRHVPERKANQIRFGNLTKALEESLRQKYSQRDFSSLLEPFHRLADDQDFWGRTLDGLAVLGAPGLFRVYRLQRPVPELAIVADSFHLKPLGRILQSADGYHILGLTRENVRLFEGNRDVLDEVDLVLDVPSTAEDVLDTDTEKAPISAFTLGYDQGGIVHGVGSRSEFADDQTTRFFRAVDRAILEHYSKPSGLQILLVALPENASDFRQVSQSPYLMDGEISVDPDSLSLDELRKRAWKAVEPQYLERLAGLIEEFGTARARELGDGDLSRVARSAASGRVATLLIEADRHVPGRIDPSTGAIEYDDLADPEVDDLLDDVAELVLRNGGQIIVVPAERMPTDSGVAAIYRF